MTALAPCPCGQIPPYLDIICDDRGKWGTVSGHCCNDWIVEFRNQYERFPSIECTEKAVAAWNAAPRMMRENDAIAAAFREVTGPNGARISNDEIADYITQRSKELLDRPEAVAWHCTNCKTEFSAPQAPRPKCPYCKAHDQYTYRKQPQPETHGVDPRKAALDELARENERLGLSYTEPEARVVAYAAGSKTSPGYQFTTPPAPVDVRALRELIEKWRGMIGRKTGALARLRYEVIASRANELEALLEDQQAK